jgi:hypothetical protein
MLRQLWLAQEQPYTVYYPNATRKPTLDVPRCAQSMALPWPKATPFSAK